MSHQDSLFQRFASLIGVDQLDNHPLTCQNDGTLDGKYPFFDDHQAPENAKCVTRKNESRNPHVRSTQAPKTYCW